MACEILLLNLTKFLKFSFSANLFQGKCKCLIQYLSKQHILHLLVKRPARDACLCMGELPAPPAPPAPAAPPAPPAPHFVFLITL